MKRLSNKHGLAAALLLAFSATVGATDFGTAPPPSNNFDVSPLQSDQTYSGFIITYKNGSTERSNANAAVQNIGVAAGRAKLVAGTLAAPRALHVRYGRKLASGADLVRTDRALSATEAATLIRQIAADPSVAYVEPEYMLKAVDGIKPAGAATFSVPNDSYYASYQWDYLAANGTGFYDSTLAANVANWGGANIQQAWSLADGTGVTIASLDTGVTNHPDLNLALANAGYDFITSASVSGRSTNGRVAGGWDTGDWTTANQCGSGQAAENSSWHGTHVFGTVGGEITNNGVGMAGTAFGAKVVPVRVLGHCGGSNADIADAITWASGGSVAGVPANANPAQVLSLSLGGSGTCPSSSVLGQAITGAIGRGATVVVAAGNSNANAANYSPASCAGAVVVAATGTTSARAYYSNYGTIVTVAAPGGGVYKNDGSSGTQVNTGFIWSTINAGTTTPTSGTYGGMAGTSQATPHVAGVVALMQSYRLSLGKGLLTPSQITSLLKSSATVPHVTPSGSKPIGSGIVNAYAAVQAAGNQP
ncbi:S8 family serine peptidase [Dyella sp. ASV21]|jgi:serine protease|uniref:S8 family serine peptidase n=1 Tax=Dyella sp. ASV21 TaxID=2795114 RepID=UPI0018EB2220|nr:S8 family serine peptidase [Dyella sp. ASV21]